MALKRRLMTSGTTSVPDRGRVRIFQRGGIALNPKSPTRLSGFTMIELMIVMGIILTLLGLIFAVGMGAQEKARKSFSRSIVDQIELTLEEFKSTTGYYPPDGFDEELRTTESLEPIQGSSALAFALTQPMILRLRQPDGTFEETERRGLHTFKQDQLFVPDEDNSELMEIVDGWKQGLHYDRLANGEEDYSIQDSGDVHLNWDHDDDSLDHLTDPREELAAVTETGPQNLGKFDLWSVGSQGHSIEGDAKHVIGNWQRIDTELLEEEDD